jgi:hypothetical protein
MACQHQIIYSSAARSAYQYQRIQCNPKHCKQSSPDVTGKAFYQDAETKHAAPGLS